jgi:hypothetical protein
MERGVMGARRQLEDDPASERAAARAPAAAVQEMVWQPRAPVAGVLRLQRTAGNRAVGRLLSPTVTAQRCGCGGGAPAADEVQVQRLGLGFLGDLAGNLFGGDDPDPLQQKPGPATCSEAPSWQPEVSIPVDIQADTALEFSQKIKSALGGNPHMQPSFKWAPDVDDKGRVTKVNMTITTKIVRPRFSGGRPTPEERALISKLEGLIKAHEERHRDIAKRFAQQALCAAVGKTDKTFEPAINAALCQMNKAQEALDHTEGTVAWTLDPTGGRVVDVKLAPEPAASYPCT